MTDTPFLRKLLTDSEADSDPAMSEGCMDVERWVLGWTFIRGENRIEGCRAVPGFFVESPSEQQRFRQSTPLLWHSNDYACEICTQSDFLKNTELMLLYEIVQERLKSWEQQKTCTQMQTCQWMVWWLMS